MNFVQSHGGRFNQLVSQRQTAFGYREQMEIQDVPRSIVAASFVSQLQSHRQQDQNNYYGYNYAMTPPRFELSPLVRRGDAVLFNESITSDARNGNRMFAAIPAGSGADVKLTIATADGRELIAAIAAIK